MVRGCGQGDDGGFELRAAVGAVMRGDEATRGASGGNSGQCDGRGWGWGDCDGGFELRTWQRHDGTGNGGVVGAYLTRDDGSGLRPEEGGLGERNGTAVGSWCAAGDFIFAVLGDVYLHRGVLYFTSPESGDVIFFASTSSVGEGVSGLRDAKVSCFYIYIFYWRCS